MDKQVKQLIATGGLLLFLAIVLVSNFKAKPAKKTGAEKQPPLNPAATSVAPEPAADGSVLGRQLERAKAPWGRDPFSSGGKEYNIGEFKLQGVSFGKNKTGFAYINNEIVKKGDKVGGYEVAEIGKDKVLLEKDGQSFYLTFPEE